MPRHTLYFFITYTFLFFAKVSVVDCNTLVHRTLTTDTRYRWGIGRRR